jgi:hypothetical protein
MKKIYILLILAFVSVLSYSQSYKFGLVHISGYNFKVVATPDFDSTGNVDISDIGFSLILPAGVANTINPVALLGGRPWTLQEFDAAFLTGLGLGDGTKDVFLFNLSPGQTLMSHTSGQQIDLVSFDVSNSPTVGVMTFLLNSDPIVMGAGGVLDSFFNANIDGTTTQDYYSGVTTGFESIDFSTLAAVDDELLSNASITVYPNPATDIISIESNIEIKTVEIFDVLGKRVLTSTQTQDINISHLQTGIYIVKANTENNDSITKKIVIK